MKPIETKNNQLYVEDIPAQDIVEEYGSPAYIYSSAEIEKNFKVYKDEVRDIDLVCYAVKAN